MNLTNSERSLNATGARMALACDAGASGVRSAHSPSLVGVRGGLSAAVLFLATLACAIAVSLICVSQAHATSVNPDGIGVYTADVSASYESPDTGEIADSGGSSSQALGQSMVQGVAQPNALVEKDGTGSALVTVRFYEANELGDILVSYDMAHDGSFTDPVAATKVGEDAAANMADYQFSVPDESATLKFNMFVNAMGREVVFFEQLSNLVEGNTAGFTQTIDVDKLKADAEAAQQAEEKAEQEAQKEQQAKVDQATGSASDQAAQDGPDVGLIVVGVVVAIVVVGVIAVAATRKRKK